MSQGCHHVNKLAEETSPSLIVIRFHQSPVNPTAKLNSSSTHAADFPFLIPEDSLKLDFYCTGHC